MPYYVVVVEAEKASAFHITGGRISDVPFRAESADLAVVRALSRLTAEDSAGPVDSPTTEQPQRIPGESRRRAG